MRKEKCPFDNHFNIFVFFWAEMTVYFLFFIVSFLMLIHGLWLLLMNMINK